MTRLESYSQSLRVDPDEFFLIHPEQANKKQKKEKGTSQKAKLILSSARNSELLVLQKKWSEIQGSDLQMIDKFSGNPNSSLRTPSAPHFDGLRQNQTQPWCHLQSWPTELSYDRDSFTLRPRHFFLTGCFKRNVFSFPSYLE